MYVVMFLMDVVDDGSGELLGGGVSSQIPGLGLSVGQHLKDGVLNLDGVIVQAHVLEHLDRAEQHGGRVGRVFADGRVEGVLGARLEDGQLGRVAGAGHQTIFDCDLLLEWYHLMMTSKALIPYG